MLSTKRPKNVELNSRNYFNYQGTTHPCPFRGQGKLSPSRGDQYQPLGVGFLLINIFATVPSIIKRKKIVCALFFEHYHLVISLFKRWLIGTHHVTPRPSHLDYYLDEFVFRFNRRTSHSRGMLFYRLIQQAVNIDPIKGADIRDGRS